MADQIACIDVHAHYYPTAYLDAVELLPGVETAHARAALASDAARDLESRFELMDSAAVNLQVVSISTLFPYAESESLASSAAQCANNEYADLVSRHPTRFAAFGALPLPHVDASLAEIARCLDELQMVGVTVGTSVLGRRISDPAFDAVFAELDRRAAVMFIHPSGVGACSPLIPRTGIGPIVEDSMAVTHLIYDGTIMRYPRMRIIACHLGGALPLLAERMNSHRANFRPDLHEQPSATLRRLWYDTAAHGSVAALRCASDVYGSDRLLLGSDYPYANGAAYRRAITYIQNAGVGLDDRHAILGGNARALLRLNSGPA